jgi:hypothetical protein
MTLQDAVANSFSHGGRRYGKELRCLSGVASTFANLGGLVDKKHTLIGDPQ